jgi:hypothetical protein
MSVSQAFFDTIINSEFLKKYTTVFLLTSTKSPLHERLVNIINDLFEEYKQMKISQFNTILEDNIDTEDYLKNEQKYNMFAFIKSI